MTYLEFSSVLRGSLPFFDMINTAGELVTPSADSVHAAMDDFDYLVDQGECVRLGMRADVCLLTE